VEWLDAQTHAWNACFKCGPGHLLRLKTTVRTCTMHANLGPWIQVPRSSGPQSLDPGSSDPLNTVSLTDEVWAWDYSPETFPEYYLASPRPCMATHDKTKKKQWYWVQCPVVCEYVKVRPYLEIGKWIWCCGTICVHSVMFPIVHLLPQACMHSNASFLSVCLSVSRKCSSRIAKIFAGIILNTKQST